MQYTNEQEKGDRYMKVFNEQRNSLQKISCAKVKKKVLKEMKRLNKKGEKHSQRYETLVKVLFEIKAYEKYFERPNTIWVQTCQDRFYSYMLAKESERKEIDKIDKERNELAQNIKSMYKERLAFIKDAWSDKNLDKDEKKQIYNEYIDTSKALHQYLIDKEKTIEKAKARKEVMKDITFGAMVLTITTTAVKLAAKGVLSVYNAVKHN